MNLVQRLVLLVVAAFLPVALAIAYGTSIIRESRERAVLEEAARSANMVAAQHQVFLSRTSAVLAGLGMFAPQAVRSAESCTSLVERLHASGHAWLDILLLDGQGIVRCSTVPGTVGSDRSAVLADTRQSSFAGLLVGPLDANSFGGPPSMPIAASWRGEGGEFGHILAIVRPAEVVGPLIQAMLPAKTAVFLADRLGRVLYMFPRGLDEKLPPLTPSLTALLRGTRPAEAQAQWLDGSDRVVWQASLDPLTFPGLRVVVGVDYHAALGPLEDAQRWVLWTLLGTLGGAILIAVWGGFHFIRAPLAVLREAALRWRDGDHTARVRLPGRSEIAALGRVFDEMADATERSERRTREGAELLDALIESSADAIFVCDREGRFMLVNTTFAKLFESTRAELLGLRDADVLAPSARKIVAGARSLAISARRPEVFDLTFAAPDERAPDAPETRVLQTICAPILGEGGEITAVAAIARDVTSERAAQQALREAKERAEAADESKTRFLAAASHDLRQPVQAALLFASLISEQASGAQRRAAEQLRLVLDDLRAMLDSLFDVSRYDAQVVRPEIIEFPLQPLLTQVLAASTAGAQSKGLRLSAPQTDVWVRSDRALLGRMISNIVENAVRYTSKGSVTITCTVRAESVRIDVRDTGPGIAAADLNRIWQEFEQLHNPERDRRQGLGLGLAIVRRLSRLLVHPVSVASTPGEGSVFSIEVPRAEAKALPMPLPVAPETQAGVAPPAETGERLAIVVEDDAALLNVLGLILEEHGWRVMSAGDAAEVLRQLNAAPATPRVILTDYRLRGGDLGSDAIATIRARIGRRVPAIILTGEIADDSSGNDGPARDADRLGEVVVLRKPVGADDLVAAVGRMATRDAA